MSITILLATLLLTWLVLQANLEIFGRTINSITILGGAGVVAGGGAGVGQGSNGTAMAVNGGSGDDYWFLGGRDPLAQLVSAGASGLGGGALNLKARAGIGQSQSQALDRVDAHALVHEQNPIKQWIMLPSGVMVPILTPRTRSASTSASALRNS